MIDNILGLLGSRNPDDPDSSVVDPLIAAGLNVMVTRFGYNNVMRVLKSMNPKRRNKK